MILAWCCWLYGKFIKWCVCYPLWKLKREIYFDIDGLEEKIYRHGVKIRRHWDKWMYAQEIKDLK